MKLDEILIVLMGACAGLVFVLVLLFMNFEFCFPVHGIDHNGRNEAFTLFLGFCN